MTENSKENISSGFSPEEAEIIRLRAKTIEVNKKAGKEIKKLILERAESIDWFEWPTIPVIDRRNGQLVSTTIEAVEIVPGTYRKLHIQETSKELIQTSNKIVLIKGKGIFGIPWLEYSKDWEDKRYGELPDWEKRKEIEMMEYVVYGEAAIKAIHYTTARFAHLARRT